MVIQNPQIILSKFIITSFLFKILKFSVQNPMEAQNFKCQHHQKQSVTFVCTANQWHFEPLCSLCIPEHTQNHSKKIKTHLEVYDKVKCKAIEQQNKAISVHQERLALVQKLLQIPQQQYLYIQEIKTQKALIINEVNLYFDKLLSETTLKRKKEETLLNQNLCKLQKDLQQTIANISANQSNNIDDFCRNVKKYYFKQNLQVYVEEIDQILEEYQKNTIKLCQFLWKKDQTIKEKCIQFLSSSYQMKNHLEENQKAKEQQNKVGIEKVKTDKKKIIKITKKKCPQCGEEMEYLTEWKKHLICRFCGGKQRNYVKK